MPRPARPWFRFYVEAFEDPKLLRLTPAQRWIWVAVLGAARSSPEPGLLLVAPGMAMTHRELARKADVKEREIPAALEEMAKLGMVELGDPISVTNWAQRQYESDDTTQRTRKHREGTVVGTTLERSNPVPGNGVVVSVGTHQIQRQKQRTSAGAEKPPKTHHAKIARDRVFSALVGLFGDASTPTARSFYGKTVTELLDVGATPELVETRGRLLLAKGWTDCGPGALVKHWDRLVPAKTAAQAEADMNALLRRRGTA